MPKRIGTASTIGQLKAILAGEELADLPDDFPVRVQTMSHEFPVDVMRHQRCLTLEP